MNFGAPNKCTITTITLAVFLGSKDNQVYIKSEIHCSNVHNNGSETVVPNPMQPFIASMQTGPIGIIIFDC